MTPEREQELMTLHDRAAWEAAICRELQHAAVAETGALATTAEDRESLGRAVASVVRTLRGWEDEAHATMMEMRRVLGRSPGEGTSR